MDISVGYSSSCVCKVNILAPVLSRWIYLLEILVPVPGKSDISVGYPSSFALQVDILATKPGS